MLWSEITQTDLEKFDENTVAILPIGSIEAHGPHLPLGTDFLDVYRIAIEAAKKTGSLVLPPVTFGYAAETRHLPGTVSFKAETLLKVLEDICDEVARNGFRKILILNGHGGNKRLLQVFHREILNEGKDYQLYVALGPFKSFLDVFEKIRETKIIGHACELETSLILYMYPDLVKLDRITIKGEVGEVSVQDDPRIIPLSDTESLVDWPSYCHEGYVGDPRKASMQKGEKLVRKWLETVVKIIDLIKKDATTAGVMKKYPYKRRKNRRE